MSITTRTDRPARLDPVFATASSSAPWSATVRSTSGRPGPRSPGAEPAELDELLGAALPAHRAGQPRAEPVAGADRGTSSCCSTPASAPTPTSAAASSGPQTGRAVPNLRGRQLRTGRHRHRGHHPTATPDHCWGPGRRRPPARCTRTRGFAISRTDYEFWTGPVPDPRRHDRPHEGPLHRGAP